MKKLSDEEIQSLLDTGTTIPVSDSDVLLYQQLYEALEKNTESALPMSFSASVLRKIKIVQRRQADLKLNLAIAALVILGGLTTYWALALYDNNIANQFLHLANDYKGIGLLVILTMVTFYWVERKLFAKVGKVEKLA